MVEKAGAKGVDQAENVWLEEQSRRRNRKKRKEPAEGGLTMNSFMDILVIMLVFLMKNFGDLPIQVAGPDLQVPTSIAQLGAEDMTTITISRSEEHTSELQSRPH